MGVVLDEAETAWSLVESVQAHDQTLDLAAFAEELVDLLFGGVEGSGWSAYSTPLRCNKKGCSQVAHVESRRIFQRVIDRLRLRLFGAVAISPPALGTAVEVCAGFVEPIDGIPDDSHGHSAS